MSKGGNFDHNYPIIIKWLRKNGIEYSKFNHGYHFKILGATTAIELWPSRMTYHVLMSEHPETTEYLRLSWNVDLKELDKLLNE